MFDQAIKKVLIFTLFPNIMGFECGSIFLIRQLRDMCDFATWKLVSEQAAYYMEWRGSAPFCLEAHMSCVILCALCCESRVIHQCFSQFIRQKCHALCNKINWILLKHLFDEYSSFFRNSTKGRIGGFAIKLQYLTQWLPYSRGDKCTSGL